MTWVSFRRRVRVNNHMKLIKGSKSRGVDNSDPHYDPKVFRGSMKDAPKGRNKYFMFGTVFIALILILTSFIERYWVPPY